MGNFVSTFVHLARKRHRWFSALGKVIVEVFGLLINIAVVITCLGLFTVAKFTGSKRTTEIVIRKVIGATTGDLIVQEYFELIIVAIAISLPVHTSRPVRGSIII